MAELKSELEYNFMGLLDQLNRLPYHRSNALREIEQNLYAELTQSPDNVTGLIVLLQNQIMQGNLSKSKALAHKIWSIGGDISPLFEAVYANALLDLGLLDMALVMVKPRLENLSANMAAFSALFYKFALVTGNLNLLEKLLANSPEDRQFQFSDFVLAYRHANYAVHFNAISKLVLETVRSNLMSIEYNLYFDRGFTDLEMELYLSEPFEEIAAIEAEIDRKIDAYCLSSRIKRINNYAVRVKNIAEHPALFSSAESEPELPSASDWGL